MKQNFLSRLKVPPIRIVWIRIIAWTIWAIIPVVYHQIILHVLSAALVGVLFSVSQFAPRGNCPAQRDDSIVDSHGDVVFTNKRAPR